jgi:hypothetical protein
LKTSPVAASSGRWAVAARRRASLAVSAGRDGRRPAALLGPRTARCTDGPADGADRALSGRQPEPIDELRLLVRPQFVGSSLSLLTLFG